MLTFDLKLFYIHNKIVIFIIIIVIIVIIVT